MKTARHSKHFSLKAEKPTTTVQKQIQHKKDSTFRQSACCQKTDSAVVFGSYTSAQNGITAQNASNVSFTFVTSQLTVIPNQPTSKAPKSIHSCQTSLIFPPFSLKILGQTLFLPLFGRPFHRLGQQQNKKLYFSLEIHQAVNEIRSIGRSNKSEMCNCVSLPHKHHRKLQTQVKEKFF